MRVVSNLSKYLFIDFKCDDIISTFVMSFCIEFALDSSEYIALTDLREQKVSMKQYR